jgi:hypothetical protein
MSTGVNLVVAELLRLLKNLIMSNTVKENYHTMID